MAANTITLEWDEKLIERGQQIAKQNGLSLSDYLKSIIETSEKDLHKRWPLPAPSKELLDTIVRVDAPITKSGRLEEYFGYQRNRHLTTEEE